MYIAIIAMDILATSAIACSYANMHVDSYIAIYIAQGQIQDFLKGGSENLKKGVWSAAPEVIGVYIVKHQNHTLA